MGGLVYAGQNGAPTEQGNQPAVKVAPRVGAVYSLSPKTVLRAGWGLYYVPWNYAAAGTDGWGQIGYSATTQITGQPQTANSVPVVRFSNPFPNGLVQPTANALGMLTGTGGEVRFVDPNKGAPRVQQYSFDLQRELPGNMAIGIGYQGSRSEHLSMGGTSDATVNINQLDPQYFATNLQFRRFTAWNIKRAMGLYEQGRVMSEFTWADQDAYAVKLRTGAEAEGLREFARATWGAAWCQQTLGF